MMTSKRGAIFAVLLLSSFGAHAQSTSTTYVFTGVTGLEYGDSSAITGVLSGTSTPTTISVPGTTSECESFFLAMINRAGTYTLTIVITVPPDLPGSPSIPRISTCRLDRISATS